MSVTIDTLLTKVEKELAYLEKRNEINVSMRIDETLTFLGSVKTDILTIKGDQKFDLVQTVGSNSTVTYKRNGVSINAGSNVLTYGDTLEITVTPAEHYDISLFKINNVSQSVATQPDEQIVKTITVTDNVAIITEAELEQFDLTETVDSNTTLVVTRDGEPVTAGTGALYYGDILTISTTYATNYEKNVLTVNGEAFTSGETHTVSDDVTIVASAKVIQYTITATLSNVTADVSNPTTIDAGGTAELIYTADDGYTIPTEAEVVVTGATGSWNYATNTLSLSEPTGNVSFTITGQA